MKDMAVSTNISGKARLEARLSVEEKELFERAAALGGFRSLTEFVLRSAKKQAEDPIEQADLFSRNFNRINIVNNAANVLPDGLIVR